MPIDCCRHRQGLVQVFNQEYVDEEKVAYWRSGLDKRSRAMVEAICSRNIAGASILEAGGGLGGVHLELLKLGATRATEVDLSPAYLAAAQEVAERAGLRDRIEYHLADFAVESDTVPLADIVVLHRVVCCYPDMPQLVTVAATHARQVLALSCPIDAWWLRAGGRLANLAFRLRRWAFRFYVHPLAGIIATAEGAGLVKVLQTRSGLWRILVFERL